MIGASILSVIMTIIALILLNAVLIMFVVGLFNLASGIAIGRTASELGITGFFRHVIGKLIIELMAVFTLISGFILTNLIGAKFIFVFFRNLLLS